jgi:acyl-coenzyme A thioesterase PaaI-like protein
VSDLVSLIGRAKASGDYGALIEAIPYARWLGIGAEVVDGELLGKLTFSDPLIGNPVIPALHGGTIGALLESTAIFKLFWEAETVFIPKTINLTVEYLRSGRPVDTWARAFITKHGRRVASVRVEAWQEDRTRPIASGAVNLLITPLERGSE